MPLVPDAARPAVAAAEAALRECLRRVFGFSDFRPGQQAVIEAVMAGENVLAIMPTGGGKSLCFQVPGIMAGGLTVVVSPLIALMRDQVAQLRQVGIEAGALNSANDIDEHRRVSEGVRSGSLRFLYLAPERLVRPDTIEMIRAAGVSLIAIDEAHCVSQWGHDFRPEYLELCRLREWLPGVRIVALTATADAATRTDMIDKLFDRPPVLFVTGFDRPNLFLAMTPKTGARKQLLRFLDAHRGESGIVYCNTRRDVETLAAEFVEHKYLALPYHGGMEAARRDANQEQFSRLSGVVMVATVAFGMGIDKPDVRFVAHAGLPKNVESYYQEVGRAGRDGLAADTLTLYGLDDIQLRRRQIEESEAPDERKRIERQRLNALIALCEAPQCRRQTLLAYFSERSPPCGNCDLCRHGVDLIDGTIEAQKILSAMVRTGERFGTEHLVNLVRGEATEAITRFGHDRLPTFGVGRDRSAAEWRSILRQLYAAEYIGLDIERYGRWTMTPSGRDLMRGRTRFQMRHDVLQAHRKTPPGKDPDAPRAKSVPLEPEDEGLFAALKELRLSLARAGNVPAYVVFPDATLLEMIRRRPESLAELRTVPGIGDVKLSRYGAAFLDVLMAASG